MRTHLLALTAIFALKAATASGQLTWGSNGAGGTGTWNVTASNWWNGSVNAAWLTNGQAIFAGTAGTVTLSGAPLSLTPSASKLTFNVPGYTLQGTGLYGVPGGLTIETNANATINSSINPYGPFPGTLIKMGAATLTVANSVDIFDRVAINNGEIKFTGTATGSGVSSYSFADAPGVFLTLGQSGSSAFTVYGLSGGGVNGGTVRPGNIAGTQTLQTTLGGGSFAGSLQDNDAGILALSVIASGFQELTGVNTYTGATAVNSGTLAFSRGGSALNSPVTIFSGTLLLDNTDTPLTDRLSDTAPIRIGGTLAFKGNGSAPLTERLGPLQFAATRGMVLITPNPGQPATLVFDSLAPRSAIETGVISFQGQNLGVVSGPGIASVRFTHAPALVGGGGGDGTPNLGILPAALGLSGSGGSFVTYGANGIRPLSDAEYGGDFSGAGVLGNVSLNTPRAILGSATINSLRLQTGGAVIGGDLLTVGSGMILAQSASGPITVSVLDFGTREGIITTDGDLAISSTILGGNPVSGVIKNGAGRLSLTGAGNFTGAINISSGTLNVRNASALGDTSSAVSIQFGAALEIQGGIAVGAKPLTIRGRGPTILGGVRSLGGFRSLGGSNSWDGAATLLTPTIRVDADSLAFNGPISLTGTCTKDGPGTLIFRNAITGSSGGIWVREGAVVSQATGGSPFGDGTNVLEGGTVVVAPAGAGADVVLRMSASVISSIPLQYSGPATSALVLAKGANRSLTLTVGPGSSNPFFRGSFSTLVLAPSGGIGALGASERLQNGSLTPGLIPLVNGIFNPSLVAQDNDVAQSADFLTYNATIGFLKAAYSAGTILQTAGAQAIFNATTPQALTADASVYALKNNGQGINLNGKTLTLGAGGLTSPGGLIFNGGSIMGGTLARASTNEIIVYTSLAGGAISSSIGIVTAPVNLTAFGPGVLTLTGDTIGTIRVNSGRLNLGGVLTGGIDLAPAATLSGTGKVTARVAGGTVAPGNSAGILTAGSTASAVTSSVTTSYAFEFTSLGTPDFGSPAASGNDVLRLTDLTTPFGSALSSANEIDVYFNLTTGVHLGDTFFGGFFTDKNAPFDNSVLGATWRVFLADPLGDIDFNGTKYRASTDRVAVSTVPQTANFGAGNVNGYITRVTVVPEPGVAASLFAGICALFFGARRRE